MFYIFYSQGGSDMRIYEKIVIDMFTGEVIEAVMYEYEGPIIHLKGGQYAAQRQANQAYKLQLQQLAQQEAQLKELDDKEKAKKYNEQRILEGAVKQRMGRTASILTNPSNLGSTAVSKPSLYS
jgi:hypothetical protein